MHSTVPKQPRRAPDAIRLHADDDVAVALRPLGAGESVQCMGQEVPILESVEQGHKIALRRLAPGDAVRKFGWPIGRATAPVRIGERVHSHNLKTFLEGLEDYRYDPLPPADLPRIDARFMGYRREDGRVGTRNEIWVLPTVGCVSRTAERIAGIAHARRPAGIEGIFAFPHPHGCSQLGTDLEGTRDILAALACHPNAGGVLIVGLGCESNQLDPLIETIPEGLRTRVRTLLAQAEQDETEAGLVLVDELVEGARMARREPAALSELTLGLKCGGSDGFSGLTANPLVG
jgi:altronate hydrolase